MDEERNSIIQTQTIVTLSKVITPKALQQCLMFIYTGTIDKEFMELQVSMTLCLINLINHAYHNCVYNFSKNYFCYDKITHKSLSTVN